MFDPKRYELAIGQNRSRFSFVKKKAIMIYFSPWVVIVVFDFNTWCFNVFKYFIFYV